MRTIQITVSEKMFRRLDKAIKKIGTSRSAFIRESLMASLKDFKMVQYEIKHRMGYTAKPVTHHEVLNWEKEQVWGDE